MRAYAKVTSQSWIDATGRKLRKHPTAQYLSLYLRTSPHANMLGLYYVAVPTMAHETGLHPSEVEDALTVLDELSVAHYDHDTETVWLPGEAHLQIEKQLKKTDNRAIGVQREFDALPESPFVADLYELYRDSFHLTAREGCRDTSPSEAPSKPLRSQEQEQEQDQDCFVLENKIVDAGLRLLLASAPDEWERPDAKEQARLSALSIAPELWRQACDYTQQRQAKLRAQGKAPIAHVWAYARRTALALGRDIDKAPETRSAGAQGRSGASPKVSEADKRRARIDAIGVTTELGWPGRYADELFSLDADEAIDEYAAQYAAEAERPSWVGFVRWERKRREVQQSLAFGEIREKLGVDLGE